MKRWKAWALAWLLAATLSALLLQAPSAHADELLVNGGFEDGVAPWTVMGNGELVPVSQPTHEGRSAVYLKATGRSARGVKRVYQLVSVAGGEEYEFSGWVLKDDPRIDRIFLSIEWCKSDQDILDCSQDRDESLQWITDDSQVYQPITTGHVIARETADSARVGIFIEPVSTQPDIEGDLTVYLDDFSFTGPAAPTPTPSPTQTPPPTASPSPSPGPTASPTPRPVASPSPTPVPTATEVPPVATPSLSTPTPTAGLVNGGFEEAGDDGTPLGWRNYGGELSRSSAARWEGQFAAAFTSRTTSTKWAYQTVAVQGGESYVLSGYALKNDANVDAAYLRLSWYASSDGSGTAMESVDSTTGLTDDSPEFRFLTSGPVAAPAEAASAKVRLMLDPVSEAEGTVYFDAISFVETTMPPEPVATPQPSPTLASSESPAASAVAPAAPPAEPGPSSSTNSASPSPAVLGATLGGPEPTVSSLNGASQSKTVSEGSPTRTPVVLYREESGDQSTQAEGRVTTGSDEGDGFSLTLLVLATALPAAAVAAIGPFVWRRWRKRARPP